MSILVSNIRIGLNDAEEVAIEIAKKRLKADHSNIKKAYVYKKSLDARHHNRISFVLSVVIDLFEKEAEAVNTASDPFISYKKKFEMTFEQGSASLTKPIIIIGFGPAGIFAAHVLSQKGYPIIVFEQGDCIEKRVTAVNEFWTMGRLNSKSNVQFGEGGAGTFSDGKLTTRISDNRCEYVLSELVQHGAPKEILTTAKPHIGTDKLRDVIINLRKSIINNGGKIYFNHQLQDFLIENNQIKGVIVNGNSIATDHIVLAIGHSARDTFALLKNKEIALENKDFSVGVRIEQLQETINYGLYGNLAEHPNIPQGEYQLSYRKGNRCVYTFCMCPGGYVVPSASSENTVVTNGMSHHSRDGKNANSALVVSVSSNDFGTKLLAGMYFQQKLEQEAFFQGGSNYKAPAMTVLEFLNQEKRMKLKKVEPTYQLGITNGDFDHIFSKDITDMLRIGLQVFDKRLPGFSKDDGILTGVETRTSSPVRILRNSDDLMSINTQGLYPCGEGAGYAGGIISAAVDGVRVAQQIISTVAPK